MIPHPSKYVAAEQTIVHLCPIGGCPWRFVEFLNQPMSVPVIDGEPRVDLVVAKREARLAATLSRHVDGHTTREWAHEVARLRAEVGRMEG